ncbi:MAG: sugar kinase [Butyrivibrio sp.]|nr:sugar kinase [Butyrivibrio sp.]
MANKEFDLITFGEIMLRLSPPNNERMTRGEVFDKRAGGSELNVASGVSLLGLRTGVISKLPANQLGTYIKNRIRFIGVSDDYLLYDESEDARLGIYYYENGAAPRKPSIIYDRKNSSITKITLDEIPEDVYSSTRMFHTSGITLALNKNTGIVTTEMIKRFKENGALISFDCNYRANLWSEEEARTAIKAIMPYVDILFVSEETSRRMMQKEGSLEDIMRSYTKDYPIKIVCTTQREVISPKKHNFTSTIYDAQANTFYTEKPYTDIDVIDRIGSGDAYVSGVLYGLLKYNDAVKALEYGNATSSVKNTIPGDLPASDLREIDSIIKNHKSDLPGSELNR